MNNFFKTKNTLILCVIIGLTLLFAAYNSWEEKLPTILFYLGTVIAAIIPSCFALFILYFVRNKIYLIKTIFQIIAYIISLFGLSIYIFYAFNGKSDSLHGAAHMHVIMFPLTYLVLSLGLIILGIVLSSFYTTIKRVKNK